ncbi:MAG: tyrosine-type recombinase/integrase [Actinomycetota bacterium]|nr:tyrosine-type recombinase/integrase [Actinomycetota bacterium]
MNVLSRLSMWMLAVGAELNDIDEVLLARFVAHERSREVPCTSTMRSLGTMLKFLRAAGYLQTADVAGGLMSPAQAAVAGWTSWMRDECGLTERTVSARVSYAAGLLDALADTDGELNWTRLEASQVNVHIAERGVGYGVVARAHIVTAVRCLLRWALLTGQLDRDLSAGILKLAGTKRSLPRGVGRDEVASLLSACDPSTPIGARDRALVLILVRLGLRAGEAARLRLDDIDWTSGQLKVTGKGREHTLPLPVDVGQALEAWLRLRPPALDRAVFVRMKAPRKTMTTSGLSGVIARLSGLAGIDPIYSHRLRHTAAMDVLAAGGTLAEAKELLGHAYTVTTMAYAKVDLTSLRELVVPFGQVPR